MTTLTLYHKPEGSDFGARYEADIKTEKDFLNAFDWLKNTFIGIQSKTGNAGVQPETGRQLNAEGLQQEPEQTPAPAFKLFQPTQQTHTAEARGQEINS